MARSLKQGVLPGMARFGAIPPSPPAAEPTEPERLRDIAARAPMRIMAPMPGVEGIVSSGQFKTQHETGTAGPQATYDPEYRKRWERGAFGPGQHPVYGYFSHGDVRDIVRSNDWTADPRSDEVSGYGHTAFQLGEHMREHTTYAWGDTLGGRPEEITKQGELPTTMPDPNAPQKSSWPPSTQSTFSRADSFYTEMHVHKRPEIGDVAQAIIYESDTPSHLPEAAQRQVSRTAQTQAILMTANIPHEVRKVGMGGQMVLPLEHEDWGEAHWKKVGPDEPGKDIERQGWSGGRYAYETPADEQRQMVTTKSKWRPDRASA